MEKGLIPPIVIWRHMDWKDVPTREEFEQLTLNMMRRGVTNSDRMRHEIRTGRALILKRITGDWNETPDNKFVNEHAWVLENLGERKVIEKTGEKEYRLAAKLDINESCICA